MSDDARSEKPVEGEPAADSDQRIRDRAYLLWEAEGKQEGGIEAYWRRALELIEAENEAAYPPTQSRGHRS